MISEHHIQVARTLRFFTAGEIHAEGRLIIALHGYGQHPLFFLKKLEVLAGNRSLVVAPEGLHRFYTQGMSGRVGASWMTKEDRLNDIADQYTYINQLLEQPHWNVAERILLGFSQGAAAAVRFFCADEQHRFTRLVLWAGSFPPDLPLPENAERLNAVGIDVVIGSADEFMQQNDVDDLMQRFEAANIRYRLHTFDGNHDLHEPTLLELIGSGKTKIYGSGFQHP